MVVPTIDHLVLILEAAKKMCHLSRKICHSITAVTKKVSRLSMIHNKF